MARSGERQLAVLQSSKDSVIRPSHLQADRSAQHFYRVSADPNVCDFLCASPARTVARCAHKDFTRSSGFDALMDDNLLVRFRQTMPDDPTYRATGSRSSCWI